MRTQMLSHWLCLVLGEDLSGKEWIVLNRLSDKSVAEFMGKNIKCFFGAITGSAILVYIDGIILLIQITLGAWRILGSSFLRV